MVANYFGVTRGTVCAWLRRKGIGGLMVTTPHYTDDRVRRTRRGTWRIFERDLEKLLRAMRVKSRPMLGPGFWKGVG